ncbi:hypothetical protein J6590_065087 [Homalodisca vitripennis]|nr:hypothetical protein J6590_065087 [Homalodisca vitripennis]
MGLGYLPSADPLLIQTAGLSAVLLSQACSPYLSPDTSNGQTAGLPADLLSQACSPYLSPDTSNGRVVEDM